MESRTKNTKKNKNAHKTIDSLFESSLQTNQTKAAYDDNSQISTTAKTNKSNKYDESNKYESTYTSNSKNENYENYDYSYGKNSYQDGNYNYGGYQNPKGKGKGKKDNYYYEENTNNTNNSTYNKLSEENNSYTNPNPNSYYKAKKSKPNKHKDISKIINQKENLKFYIQKTGLELPEQTNNLINELIEGSIECMICNDTITHTTEIWECDTCFTIYHNTCIYDWIFKLNSTTDSKAVVTDYKWTCPHCSHNYKAEADKLPVYNCYCGKFYDAQKSRDLNFNPNLIPHGCGLGCNKAVCKHVTCTLPCHPGPHLPCNVIEKIKCYCEKLEREIPCNVMNKNFTCKETCGKLLHCNKHKCKVKCHDGECDASPLSALSQLSSGNNNNNKSILQAPVKKCDECIIESKNKFYGFLKGLEDKIRKECNDGIALINLADGLSEYIFHGTLLCGYHQVEANTDNNLQFLLKLLQISGGRLVENIKKFIPVCKHLVDNSCECRNKVNKTECFKLNYSDDILQFLGLQGSKEKPVDKCTKVCKSFKNCKNHRCSRVCCELSGKLIRNFSLDDPEGYHLCLLACGRALNCGQHYCENFCHKGECKPCPNIIRDGSIQCDCGRTKLEAPYKCGSEVNCKLLCDKDSKCEHKCKLTCHKDDCAPCEETTFKVCRCKKNIIKNVVCGNTIAPICKTICGEMLPCGVHFCQVPCHDHTEEYDLKYFCAVACGRELMQCKHVCTKRCHGEEDCVEVDCSETIKIFCKCKVSSKNIKCGEYKKLTTNDAMFILPCNEECAKKDRLKKIEQAFDDLLKLSEQKNKFYHSHKRNELNDNNNTSITISSSGMKFADTKFDTNTLNFGKKNAKFVIELEALIEKAVKNQMTKYEIPKFEKKLFIPCSEFLKTYYNIKVEKVKRGEGWATLQLSDCSEAVLPKYRLSLFGLLFKFNKFAENQKLNIYHPFEMSILIQNYRYSVLVEDIEAYLLTLCALNKNEFYIDEIEKGKCYVHFFNLQLGKKVYYQIKSKPSQFQDSYEIYYNLKDDLKMDELYLYLKNVEYLNSLYYKDDGEKGKESNGQAEKNEEEEADADGFVLISKGKKPK